MGQRKENKGERVALVNNVVREQRKVICLNIYILGSKQNYSTFTIMNINKYFQDRIAALKKIILESKEILKKKVISLKYLN